MKKLTYISKIITTFVKKLNFSQTRDENTPQTRDIKHTTEHEIIQSQPKPGSSSPVVFNCPYCSGKNIILRGKRKNKYESRQLYLCKDCNKTFTGQKIKGKQFPLRVILEGISLYNNGFTLEESCNFLKSKFGLEVGINTLSTWVKEFSNFCRYSRMRDYGLKLFSPVQTIQSVRLYHRQVFNFQYHRAKIALILQEYKNTKFEPLREFLDLVAVECPHQMFIDGIRISEIKPCFDISEVVIRSKHNFACRIAEIVLQAINDNKLRHQSLQRFMLCNDSVTVACEVPVYLTDEDVEHLKNVLEFDIPLKLEKPLTGHIDILQIRNGCVHILDYKPTAKKEKPIEQLTLYALALSRLTGLRIYEIKCAWFDEQNYFEFFPLHVVYKLRKKQKFDNINQLKLNGIIQEKQL